MNVSFVLNGNEISTKYLVPTPRVGENVVLNDIAYRVHCVTHWYVKNKIEIELEEL